MRVENPLPPFQLYRNNTFLDKCVYYYNYYNCHRCSRLSNFTGGRRRPQAMLQMAKLFCIDCGSVKIENGLQLLERRETKLNHGQTVPESSFFVSSCFSFTKGILLFL
jgi:hypothetical protein